MLIVSQVQISLAHGERLAIQLGIQYNLTEAVDSIGSYRLPDNCIDIWPHVTCAVCRHDHIGISLPALEAAKKLRSKQHMATLEIPTSTGVTLSERAAEEIRGPAGAAGQSGRRSARLRIRRRLLRPELWHGHR